LEVGILGKKYGHHILLCFWGQLKVGNARLYPGQRLKKNLGFSSELLVVLLKVKVVV